MRDKSRTTLIVNRSICMILNKFTLGMFASNCYILGSKESKECIIVDCGDKSQEVVDYIKSNNLIVKYIINTHGHLDHIMGNNLLKKEFNAPLCIHSLDEKMLSNPLLNGSSFYSCDFISEKADILLKDADSIQIENLKLIVMHTPGHSEGSICLLSDNYVLTGDTLFQLGIGRTDLPGGSENEILNSIKNKLFQLDNKMKVYPGHGNPTTIGYEKQNNPFFDLILYR